jgi:hypothetical protein
MLLLLRLEKVVLMLRPETANQGEIPYGSGNCQMSRYDPVLLVLF